MSDFYNYHEDDQRRPEQSANDYNYYQQTSDGARRTYSPYDTPEPNKSCLLYTSSLSISVPPATAMTSPSKT